MGQTGVGKSTLLNKNDFEFTVEAENFQERFGS